MADQHFLLGRSDIALTDGSTIRAGAGGIALGLLPRFALPTTDTAAGCDRHKLAKALTDHYPDAGPVWVPMRCADRPSVRCLLLRGS